ncbi:hypothetical protein [Halovenus salina]|uniref:DNA primase/polymerase bifunctional N-terminal domain-containing protein n=1 Tax=Halovenus salina TaxID=1510225 RepID=A0ABD5W755_9EURY
MLVNDEEDPDTDAPEGGLPDETPTPDAEKDGFDPVENGEIEIYEDGDDRVAGQPEDGGVRTDPDEFKRFHELLTAEAPDGYTPYYIKCERDEKGPFGGGAWSNPENRLSVEEAIAWLESGGNIGIVGTTDDCLVDLDVDDPDLVAEEDVKQTLRATSRSRGGYHGWYFGDDEIPNIDSDAGEVRAMNQYVLAPGSHVPVNLDDPDDPDLDEIAPSERENVGRYSLTEEHPVARLEYEEIPPIYREEHEQRQEVIEQRPDRRDDPPEPTGDGDNRSAVFDLDITDVTGLSWGYRGVNPIGHHSNDHRGNDRYFKIDREHGARDFKDNVSYSPASWVLADAGERDPRIPNGGLTDREYFVYWRYCKENNLVPADDPIPRRALVWVAIDTGLCDSDDVEDGWKLPADAHNDALDAVREKYDLDPGRDPVPSDDADAVAPLPLALLDRLTGEERERAARKRGLNIPTTDDARTRLRDAVFRELRAGNTTVLDAPTALGKSHTVATEPWRRRGDVTGEAPVVHLHATTDARDDAASKTRDSGANGAVLKGRKEISPLARGDHDPRAVAEGDEDRQVVTIDGEPASQWLDRQCDEKGLPFSTALTLARERNDQDLDDLPPEGQEDPAVAQWNGIPRTEDGDPAKDVIHGTHQFAYVPSLRRHTNVILDEQPDFTVEVSDERIQRGVSSYLQAINAPVSSWTGLIALADADLSGSTSDAAKERSALDDALDKDPPTEWYADDRDAHALAPDLARAVWRAVRYGDADGNGRRSAKVLHEPPRLDAGDGDQYAGAWLSVVIDDEDYTVQSVWSTPDLSQARAVVGLDAHPSMPMWELNGAPGMDRDAVLDPAERRLWRRYERGLSVVQIGDATRPAPGATPASG